MAERNGTLELAWRRQRRWSKAANAAKTALGRWRLAALVLVLTGAVVGTAAARLGDGGWWAAAVAVLTIGLSPWVAGQAGKDRIRDATHLRAVSEGLKAEVFTCLALARPYDGEDRLAVLDRRLEELAAGRDRLRLQVSAIPDEPRDLPEVGDTASYVDVRLDGQIKYYRESGTAEGRRALRCRRAQWVLAGVAGLFAAAAAVPVTHWAAAWIGVFTTAATAVTTHAAAARYESHVVAYEGAADELAALRARWADGRAADVVLDCERLLAAQNGAWLAQWNAGSDGRPGTP